MKETGLKMKEMDRVMRSSVIKTNIKEVLKEIKLKEEVLINGEVETSTKDSGLKESEVVKGDGEVLKERYMKETGYKIKHKDMVL